IARVYDTITRLPRACGEGRPHIPGGTRPGKSNPLRNDIPRAVNEPIGFLVRFCSRTPYPFARPPLASSQGDRGLDIPCFLWREGRCWGLSSTKRPGRDPRRAPQTILLG